MLNVTIPYLIPIFLGMTYDARNSKPGVDIFDKQYVDQPEVTTLGQFVSVYKLVNTTTDRQSALNIEGDFSLKVKSGMLDFAGKGAYIKNEVNFTNRIEIITTLKYTSKTMSLKNGAVPRKDWITKFNPSVLGTHYVHTIIYGAELIASARFVVLDSKNYNEVSGDINAALGGTDGSANSLVAEGKLENLEKKLSGKANLEISYYGTVPLKSIPNSIDGLRTLVRSFKEQVEEAGLQDGIPMSVQLTSLTTLCDEKDKDKFQFLKNSMLENKLRDFEEKFDEMRQARLDLIAFAKSLPYNLQPEYEEEIGTLLNTITEVLEMFYNTVWAMDLTKGPEQLNEAFNRYNQGGGGIYDKYAKLVRALKMKLTPLINWNVVATDTYVQWGNDNCTAEKTQVLYKGFTVSSSEEGIGGSATYSCAATSLKKGYDLADGPIKSRLSGIRYTSFDKSSNPFQGPHAKKIPGQGLPCALCFSPDAAAVDMFPAASTCPSTWELMYKGYLMSSRDQRGHTTEYICADETPSEPYKMTAQPQSRDTAALTIIRSAGSLPSTLYPDSALVQCVVCSMKSNQVTF